MDSHGIPESATQDVLDRATIDKGSGATTDPDDPGDSVTLTDSCTLYNFLIFAGPICTLCVLGLIGNGLTLTILWREKDKSATFFLLQCLAVCDSFVLVCWTLVQAPISLLYFKNMADFVWKRSPYMTIVLSPLCTVTHTMATWLVVMVTWQRYVAVCYPHRVKSLGSLQVARMQAMVVCLTSFLVNLPRFFERRIEVTPTRAMYVLQDFVHADSYQKGYKVGFYYAFNYCIPLLCLILMTYKLIRNLEKSKRRVDEMTSTMKQHHDITFVLVVVVIIFCVCQLFNPARRIMEALSDDGSTNVCGGALPYFTPWVIAAVIFNSSVNFVIYTVCGARFRRRLILMFKRKSGSKVHTASSNQAAAVGGSRGRGTKNSVNTAIMKHTESQKPTAGHSSLVV